MLPDKSAMLSVVLPCYNPAGHIYNDILSGFIRIKNVYPDVELIVVNDGSTRNFTEEEARSAFKGYPEITIVSYRQNRGKGHALREGMKVARGKIFIYTDVDFPYAEQSFFEICETVNCGRYDVAIGIRPEEYYTHLPKSRTRISKFLRFLIRRFLKIPTDDTQCGLKGFNEKGREVFLQTSINRYLFDLEFIFLAARKKLPIKTVEVELRPDIILAPMRWGILMQEFGNFLKIFAQSFF